MKLGTYLTGDGLRAVALQGDQLVELGPSLRDLLAGGPEALDRALAASGSGHPLAYERLGPMVADPGKVLCIGRNYAEHADELGNQTSARPEVFLRSRTSLAGPRRAIAQPRVSDQMDWEVELAAVIGRPGRYIAAEHALDHVAGYGVFNDISLRDFQNAGKQWTAGKNFDGTGPLGPFLVTADEVLHPFDLALTRKIVEPDGSERVVQRSNTSLMVHRLPEIIAFLSLFTTLEAGDVIATGTPGGVGLGRKPPEFLRPGQLLVSAIEGLGELRNPIVTEAD
ncbi:MAG: fumarylacetoacetate hydrolase family protein [Candidatus Dormibacteraeota bacterium]|uniref:Fumarylacetoacetate hydrolase family protein n=1 Tax=Candidatus Dormiibacter inghamiae TaxID=3127013 RepID=A0A934KBW7_9BACT|nr:fumarylacetoacetate hydrolase family protein [Candidatus Dormibacteraeota bacterium]MBJ7605667.1 fumarylacetoacetate hydrolase family protein [Candidatus Dormibacteraeota bacterium]